MKRSTNVEAIVEFILSKPGVPYHEVEDFARSINATDDEFFEALSESSDFIHYLTYFNNLRKNGKTILTAIETGTKPDKKNFTLKYKPATKYLRLVGIFLLAVITGAVLFTNMIRNNGNSAVTISNPQVTPARANKLVPPVFANQAKIDATRVFSYPPSDITLAFSGIPNKEIVGFFPYWMLDVADQINLAPYTAINLFGLTVSPKGEIITAIDGEPDQGWQMWQDERFSTFIERARKNDIKLLLTFKSFNDDDINSLAASDVAQKTFISNAIQLVNSESLDGINIDFEPTKNATEDQSAALTRLIANLNAELKRQIPNASLTIDVYLSSASDENLFNIKQLGDYVDEVIIMGYDVHTPRGNPGPVAPMEGADGILGYAQSFLTRIDPAKIILAVPYYGYDWPISGKGEAKILSYAEIAHNSRLNTISWNETYQSPFYYYYDADTGSERVVYFDNTRSLGIKYDFVNKAGLAGIGIWAIGYDGLNHELEQVIADKFVN